MSSSSNSNDVLISEVGPRDGLQSVKAIMATADKFRWIDALVDAGLSEIEVGSFVPAKHLPQMADTAEVVRHSLTHPGVTAHSRAHVRKTREDMILEVRAIVALRDRIAPGVKIEAGLSTAFGCTIQGEVKEDDVVWLAGECAAAGVDDVGLSDSTGMANPAQVRRLFNKVRAVIGAKTGAAHMHNTRGLGLANCLAAYDVGVRTFASSLGGLGGCPYAPGASGNVVTEDLVFMFEAMGVRTGVDLEKIVAARAPMMAGLPGEPVYGMTPEVGLPKGWSQCASSSGLGQRA